MTAVSVFTGADVAEVLDDLARLRIAVFREWPYLYDGDLDYEREYLKAYESPGAIVVAAYDGAAMVGASTGAPMEDHADDFAAALGRQTVALTDIFYCAESVLLPQYRGQGLGHRFFDERERHARELGRTHSAFAAVVRPKNHPQRPVDYRPLDEFWRRRGYARLDGAVAEFEWKDIGEPDPTHKPLQFWMRAL